MELKEGMYVRTKNGMKIGKIVKIHKAVNHKSWYELKNGLRIYSYEEINKPSYNIIDLIEERDFVKVRIDNIFINCFMVDLFEDENENQELGIGCYEDGLLNSISEYRPLNTLEILEVVTKEQFESMSYKL